MRKWFVFVVVVLMAVASSSCSNSEVEALRTEIEGLRAEVAKFKAGDSRTDEGSGAKAIRGRFVAGEKSYIRAITLDPDAMVATLESPLFLMTSGKMAYSYKATGKKIYVRDPQKGDITFTIKDKNTIVCEMKIIGDVYRRAASDGVEAFVVHLKAIMVIIRDKKDDCDAIFNGVTEYVDKHKEEIRALNALSKTRDLSKQAKMEKKVYQTTEKILPKTIVKEIKERCPGTLEKTFAVFEAAGKG